MVFRKKGIDGQASIQVSTLKKLFLKSGHIPLDILSHHVIIYVDTYVFTYVDR